jgi:hypothetical protein
MFALAPDDAAAGRVAAAIREAYAGRGVSCAVRVTEVDRQGAIVSPA